MSLEEALAKNTAALIENNELLKLLTSKAKDGVKASTEAGSGETASRGRGRPAKDKEKIPSGADLKAAATKFLDIADEDIYAERRKALIELREKYGAESIPDIKEGDRAEALAAIEKMIEDADKPAPSRRDDV